MNTDAFTEARERGDLAGVARMAGQARDFRDSIQTRTALPRSTKLPALIALNRTGKHIYAGTADPVEVARRRAANKRARKARRGFRQSNARKGVR